MIDVPVYRRRPQGGVLARAGAFRAPVLPRGAPRMNPLARPDRPGPVPRMLRPRLRGFRGRPGVRPSTGHHRAPDRECLGGARHAEPGHDPLRRPLFGPDEFGRPLVRSARRHRPEAGRHGLADPGASGPSDPVPFREIRMTAPVLRRSRRSIPAARSGGRRPRPTGRPATVLVSIVGTGRDRAVPVRGPSAALAWGGPSARDRGARAGSDSDRLGWLAGGHWDGPPSLGGACCAFRFFALPSARRTGIGERAGGSRSTRRGLRRFLAPARCSSTGPGGARFSPPRMPGFAGGCCRANRRRPLIDPTSPPSPMTGAPPRREFRRPSWSPQARRAST